MPLMQINRLINFREQMYWFGRNNGDNVGMEFIGPVFIISRERNKIAWR